MDQRNPAPTRSTMFDDDEDEFTAPQQATTATLPPPQEELSEEVKPDKRRGPRGPRAAVSKMEMVRQALAAGMDKPKDISEWIKTNHGVDCNPAHASSYKSKLQKEAAASQTEAEPKPVNRRTLRSLVTETPVNGHPVSNERVPLATAKQAPAPTSTPCDTACVVQDFNDLAAMYRRHGPNLDTLVNAIKTAAG